LHCKVHRLNKGSSIHVWMGVLYYKNSHRTIMEMNSHRSSTEGALIGVGKVNFYNPHVLSIRTSRFFNWSLLLIRLISSLFICFSLLFLLVGFFIFYSAYISCYNSEILTRWLSHGLSRPLNSVKLMTFQFLVLLLIRNVHGISKFSDRI
jgi:hypothetical protein